MLLRWVRIRAKFSSNIVVPPDGLTVLLQAAARRSADRSRMDLRGRGPPSSAHNASSISSMVTGAFNPTGARSEGQDAIAEAPEAHEDRLARSSPMLRPGWETTSCGCWNLVPG